MIPLWYMKRSLSYRYSLLNEFALNSEVLLRDSDKAEIMSYSFDVKKDKKGEVKTYLTNFVEKENPTYEYESKESIEEMCKGQYSGRIKKYRIKLWMNRVWLFSFWKIAILFIVLGGESGKGKK